jgi:hypothetical protein
MLSIRQTALLVAASAAAVGCDTSDRDTASASSQADPPTFADDHNASVASDGRSAVMVVAGVKDNAFRLKVLRTSDGVKWQEQPSVGGSVDGNVPVRVALRAGAACLPLTRQAVTHVVCQSGRAWSRIPSPAKVRWRSVVDLTARGEVLYALVTDGRRLHVFASRSGRRWRRVGATLTQATGIAHFTSDAADASPPGITTMSMGRRSARRLLEFRGTRWRPAGRALTTRPMGASITGAVRTPRGYALAVNEAESQPWTFSVFVTSGKRWRRVSLERSRGNAQGGIAVAGGRAYAVWQEHADRGDGMFDARVAVRPLDTATGRPGKAETVWEGRSIGPGDIGVFALRGRAFAHFMRPHPDDPNQLKLSVAPLGGV